MDMIESHGRRGIRGHRDPRDGARKVIASAQLAASAGLIVAFASHLAGAHGDTQMWLSLAVAAGAVGLRALRLI